MGDGGLKGVGPVRLDVGWVLELQLFALFGRFQPQQSCNDH